MTRDLDADGIAFLKGNESCLLHPYPDEGASIGWGHHIRPGDPWYDACQAVLARGLVGTALASALAAVATIPQADADSLFLVDVRPCVACINAIVHVEITQPQFNALVDFVYNEGVGAPFGSTWLRLLNSGEYTGAADALLMWDKDKRGGVLVDDPVLLARRKKERALFLSELPPEAAA
jgi:GH24 family phage-related lysozyme (muramidase)